MGTGKGSSGLPSLYQKDGKEKLRIRKRPGRQPPLSGTHSEAYVPIVAAPALLAPHPAPTPGLELPGFFPGSGILREVTPGTEQTQATQRGSEQDPSPHTI